MAIVRMERLGQLENIAIISGIKPATFRLAVQRRNQLRYCAYPPFGTMSRNFQTLSNLLLSNKKRKMSLDFEKSR
jgi:hypothetical protein